MEHAARHGNDVVLIDTAGLDDEGELGVKRVEKAYEELRRCNLALVVTDAASGVSAFEEEFLEQLKRRRIPAVLVINKSDAAEPEEAALSALSTRLGVPVTAVSATSCRSAMAGNPMIFWIN